MLYSLVGQTLTHVRVWPGRLSIVGVGGSVVVGGRVVGVYIDGG